MKFELIDFEKWERREYYLHYINKVVCSYSMSVNVDITNLKEHKLYPAMLWFLTKTVNEFPQFRTALTDKGLGVYDTMNPSYTIFNSDKRSFCVIWSEYSDDLDEFCERYDADVEKYTDAAGLFPKSDRPENLFDVSMIPWATFSSFNYNVYDEGKYLLPIFTMGKFFEQDGRLILPLAIQVHHAVCDGYHISAFVESLQNKIDEYGI